MRKEQREQIKKLLFSARKFNGGRGLIVTEEQAAQYRKLGLFKGYITKKQLHS
jgi:hypothetical protein